MTKNNTKTTSIIAITFFAALLMIPIGMNHASADTVTLISVQNQTGFVGMAGPSCANSTAHKNLNVESIWVGPRLYDPNISSAGCNRAFVTWDTSQVNQTISSVEMSFDVQPENHPFHNNNVNGVIHAVTNDPRTTSASTLQTDIADGTLYLSANPAFSNVGNQTVTMNQNFVTDMNNNSDDFIRIGIIGSNESTTAFDLVELKNIKIILTYNQPTLFCGEPESYYNVINGTDSSDYLFGTRSPDLIFGNGGNDIIKSQGENNCIYGGDGNDFVLAAKKGNTVYGGTGDDSIKIRANGSAYGEDGNDMILIGNPTSNYIVDGGNGSSDVCVADRPTTVISTVSCEITS